MTGTVENVVYHNDKNQYTVLELSTGGELVTVVGAFPFVSEGEELHVIGTWSSHPSFGDQFKAETFERARPATTAAMLKYLSSGAVKGVGAATARRIIDTFGVQALTVIENEPERLAQITGITKEKAEAISAELKRVYGIRELMAFLGAFGVRPEETVLVWKAYGAAAISCILLVPSSSFLTVKKLNRAKARARSAAMMTRTRIDICKTAPFFTFLEAGFLPDAHLRGPNQLPRMISYNTF